MAATIYEPLSTAHLKACTVDFDSRPDKKAVNLVQYDQTIPVLCVSLKKGGTEYKVPSDADVNIRMDKRDGYHVYNPALGVNAERAIAYFAVTPQMSTGWGDYYPIVEITVGGGVAGSAPIWLHFDRNPLPENAIISSDEYKTIQQLLEDVKAVKADTEAIKTATEQIKAQTEAVRDQAKGFADNAKNSADKAQTLVDGMPSDYSQAMKDIGTLKNQMQRAYPDDSTIGENTWSSKNIVDMLCPEIKESGNPVLCYPVAGYPLGVKAKWEPMQEGSGTPYPAGGGKNLFNPAWMSEKEVSYGVTWTITPDGTVTANGTTDSTAYYNSDYFSLPAGTYTISAMPHFRMTIRNADAGGAIIATQQVGRPLTFTVENDVQKASLFFTASGTLDNVSAKPQIEKGATATAYAPYENIRPIKGRDSVTVERCGENLLDIAAFSLDVDKNNSTYKTNVQQLIPPGKYTLKVTHTNPNSGLGMQLFTRNGNKISIISGGTFNLDDILDNIYFYIGNVSGNADSIKDIMLIPSTSTATTTYTPYIGQTNTLTLPETVYGGEVDAVSSEGQETQKLVILNGTESWNSWGINAHNPAITGFYTFDINDYDAINSKGICSHLETPNQDVWGGRNAGIGFATVGSSRYFMFSMMTSSLPDISAGHEVASLKAYLAAQNDAGTPVQIAYKLAEPVPFTATGAQPIKALSDTNTVLTDADSATVTGRADPIKRITDLEDAVASQT